VQGGGAVWRHTDVDNKLSKVKQIYALKMNQWLMAVTTSIDCACGSISKKLAAARLFGFLSSAILLEVGMDIRLYIFLKWKHQFIWILVYIKAEPFLQSGKY
jgi:hypothetical protein